MSLKETQVFTPLWATNQMLDMLDQSVFSSDDTFFFEPSCGDGSLLIPTLERIYNVLLDKCQDHEKAVAETLHKFFAVELDEELVKACRVNVWNFTQSKTFESTDYRKLAEYLIANQIRDAVEHNNFFEVMNESKAGTISRKSKRQNLQKLQRDKSKI